METSSSNTACAPFIQKIPPVLGGGDALGLFEYLGEHAVIPIARLFRHLCNGKRGGKQQLFCLIHTDIGQVSQEIHPNLTFEQLADILGIQMELFSQNRETDFLRQMLLEIPGDAGDG